MKKQQGVQSIKHSRSKDAILFVTALALALAVALPALAATNRTVMISSYGTINTPSGVKETQVARFPNSNYYVEDAFTGTIIFQSSNAAEAINFALVSSVLGKVTVKNIGQEYTIYEPIVMQSHTTLILEDGVVIRGVTEYQNVIMFAGTRDNRLVDSHLIGLGKAVLTGVEVGTGLYMRYANDNLVTNIEIADVGSRLVEVILSNNNTLENIYGHRYSIKGGADIGVTVTSSSRNKFINCIIDAEQQPSSRTALLIIGEYGDTSYNEVIGGEYKNVAAGNGIYVCSGEYSTDYTRIENVRVSGNQHPGHSGLKIRPSKFATVIGLISENNYNGMEMGTTLDTGVSFNPNSTFNYIQGIFRNNLNVGVIVGLDWHGYSVTNNTFEIISQNNGNNGVWISDIGVSNGTIAFNNFSGTTNNNALSGIKIDSTKNSTYIKRNYFNVTSQNNLGHGVFVGGASAVDNRIDVSATNNTWNVYDGGTRTRINGFGKEAAGVGNPPTASLWDVSDTVENTDDHTTWVKDPDGKMRKLS